VLVSPFKFEPCPYSCVPVTIKAVKIIFTDMHGVTFVTRRRRMKGSVGAILALPSFLDLVDYGLDHFLCVAESLLAFSFYLLRDSFGLLIFVAQQLTGSLLCFSGDVFRYALDLIFVHDWIPER
jgi:hypothetical protein